MTETSSQNAPDPEATAATGERYRGRIAGWVILALFLGGVGGWLLRGGGASGGTPAEPTTQPGAEEEAPEDTIWTCSMHPQIRMPEEGKCPICFMALIALESGAGGDDHPRRLVLSPAARELARVQTVRVERRHVETNVSMVGKVAYDERSVRHIAAWVPGRLERLFVDYTGIPVQEGEHLVTIYSPEVFAAQEELIQLKASLASLPDGASRLVRRSTERSLESARAKLELWGLLPEQVAEIEARGTAADTITIYAPQGGIVVEKHAVEGMYVSTGTRVYTIADLTHLWVLLDAYESDLAWLRYGQQVTFEVEAYPGEVFAGRISFIDPTLDPRRRTSKVRVNVDNSNGRLKPEMFVRAIARARLATNGVVDTTFAGKWISPMHPEIVKDEPGTCDVCGMPLVRAEALGYVSEGSEPPLIVPTSAPLVTGRRAVVYVEVPDQERPTYEGREVVLGPRAGDYYLVESGLREGERVVTRGNFKIDSALQIQARPSMMSMPSERPHDSYVPPLAFVQSLSGVISRVLATQEALAADDLAAGRSAAQALVDEIAGVDALGAGVRGLTLWEEVATRLRSGAQAVAAASDISSARAQFEGLSSVAEEMISIFGHDEEMTIVRVRCPMAFKGRGASWLQWTGEVANPYYGASMLRCGAEKERFEPMSAIPEDSRDDGHVRGASAEQAPAAVQQQLGRLFDGYALIGQALADDDATATKAAAAALHGALGKIGATGLSDSLQKAWDRESRNLESALMALHMTEDIADQRESFEVASIAMELILKELGFRGVRNAYKVHCPMAFNDRGANWLQTTEEVANPYFGAAMLRCGAVEEEIPAAGR